MARLIGPDSGDRATVRPGGAGYARLASVVVYAASSGDTLANILTEDGDAVADSTLTTDDFGLIPLFQFPDGVDTVYVEVDGGPRTAVYARYDDRVDGLAARVATLETTTQVLDGDLTTIAGLDSTTAGALATDGAGWVRKTYAQLKTAMSFVKGDVGLGNVDNTSDVNKPISTATQTALDLKLSSSTAAGTYAPLVSPALTGTPTVNGTPIGTGAGLPSTIQTKTTTYTAAAGEFVLADATSAGFTVTLPTAPATGALVTVKKTDTTANVVTVAPAGGGTIDGDANATITSPQFGGIFEHTGSNVWKVVAPTSAGGSNGVNGNTILSGAGAPAGGTGVNGDFYLDTTNTRLYGPKAAGAWPGGYTSLIGPAGSNGTNGAISQLQDEGSNLTVRGTINFTGAGVTATDDAGNSRTNVTIAGGAGILSLAKSGLYFCTPTATVPATGGNTTALNAMTVHAIVVPTDFTVDRIGVEVTATAASAAFRLGIYAESGGAPAALILDAGTVDASSTTGFKEITISQALTAGVYFLALAQQGGLGQYRYVTPIHQLSAPSAQNSFQNVVGYRYNGVSGALPSSLASTSVDVYLTAGATSSGLPRILLRRA